VNLLDNKITVIYNTCDKYEPLWNGFFTQFKKYWSGYTGDIVLNTEEKSFAFEGLDIIRPVGKNTGCSWSQRILNSLAAVSTPYVVMILDDFYFKSPVKTGVIDECTARMDKDRDTMLFTFGWQPGKNIPDPESELFERRGRFAPYRVNAQIGLWRVSYLKKILRSYENPWQFELSGSFRSSLYGGKLYSLKKDAPLVFDYDWGFLIIRGKLNREVSDYFAQHEGLDMELPFEPFDGDARADEMSKGRGRRIVGYAKDAVVSLFKR